jgi:hypothetical protein
MIKRIFSRKWVFKLLILSIVACVLIGGGTALAATYDRDIYMGYNTGYYWGAAILEASETVDWLKVESYGIECCWWQEYDWDQTNLQLDTWIVGASGGGSYTLWGCPFGSTLTSAGEYWWPPVGNWDIKWIIIPHPGWTPG